MDTFIKRNEKKLKVRTLTTHNEKLSGEIELLKERNRALEDAMKQQEAQREQYSKAMEAQVASFNETIGKMTMMMRFQFLFVFHFYFL